MVKAIRIKGRDKKVEVTPLVFPAGLYMNRDGQEPILRRHEEGQVSLWWPDGTVELYVPAKEEDWVKVEAPRVELN